MADCSQCLKLRATIQRKQKILEHKVKQLDLFKKIYDSADFKKLTVEKVDQSSQCCLGDKSLEATQKLLSIQVSLNEKYSKEISELRSVIAERQNAEEKIKHVEFINKQLASYYVDHEDKLNKYKRFFIRCAKTLLKFDSQSSIAEKCLKIIPQLTNGSISTTLKDLKEADSSSSGVQETCGELLRITDKSPTFPPSSVLSAATDSNVPSDDDYDSGFQDNASDPSSNPSVSESIDTNQFTPSGSTYSNFPLTPSLMVNQLKTLSEENNLKTENQLTTSPHLGSSDFLSKSSNDPLSNDPKDLSLFESSVFDVDIPLSESDFLDDDNIFNCLTENCGDFEDNCSAKPSKTSQVIEDTTPGSSEQVCSSIEQYSTLPTSIESHNSPIKSPNISESLLCEQNTSVTISIGLVTQKNLSNSNIKLNTIDEKTEETGPLDKEQSVCGSSLDSDEPDEMKSSLIAHTSSPDQLDVPDQAEEPGEITNDTVDTCGVATSLTVIEPSDVSETYDCPMPLNSVLNLTPALLPTEDLGDLDHVQETPPVVELFLNNSKEQSAISCDEPPTPAISVESALKSSEVPSATSCDGPHTPSVVVESALKSSEDPSAISYDEPQTPDARVESALKSSEDPSGTIFDEPHTPSVVVESARKSSEDLSAISCDKLHTHAVVVESALKSSEDLPTIGCYKPLTPTVVVESTLKRLEESSAISCDEPHTPAVVVESAPKSSEDASAISCDETHTTVVVVELALKTSEDPSTIGCDVPQTPTVVVESPLKSSEDPSALSCDEPHTPVLAVESSLNDPASPKSSLSSPCKAAKSETPQITSNTTTRTTVGFELNTSSDIENEVIQCFSKVPKLISPLRPPVSSQPSEMDNIEVGPVNTTADVSSPQFKEISTPVSCFFPVTNCSTNPDQLASYVPLLENVSKPSQMGIGIALSDKNELRTKPTVIPDLLTSSIAVKESIFDPPSHKSTSMSRSNEAENSVLPQTGTGSISDHSESINALGRDSPCVSKIIKSKSARVGEREVIPDSINASLQTATSQSPSKLVFRKTSEKSVSSSEDRVFGTGLMERNSSSILKKPVFQGTGSPQFSQKLGLFSSDNCLDSSSAPCKKTDCSKGSRSKCQKTNEDSSLIVRRKKCSAGRESGPTTNRQFSSNNPFSNQPVFSRALLTDCKLEIPGPSFSDRGHCRSCNYSSDVRSHLCYGYGNVPFNWSWANSCSCGPCKVFSTANIGCNRCTYQRQPNIHIMDITSWRTSSRKEESLCKNQIAKGVPSSPVFPRLLCRFIDISALSKIFQNVSLDNKLLNTKDSKSRRGTTGEKYLFLETIKDFNFTRQTYNPGQLTRSETSDSSSDTSSLFTNDSEFSSSSSFRKPSKEREVSSKCDLVTKRISSLKNSQILVVSDRPDTSSTCKKLNYLYSFNGEKTTKNLTNSDVLGSELVIKKPDPNLETSLKSYNPGISSDVNNDFGSAAFAVPKCIELTQQKDSKPYSTYTPLKTNKLNKSSGKMSQEFIMESEIKSPKKPTEFPSPQKNRNLPIDIAKSSNLSPISEQCSENSFKTKSPSDKLPSQSLRKSSPSKSPTIKKVKVIDHLQDIGSRKNISSIERKSVKVVTHSWRSERSAKPEQNTNSIKSDKSFPAHLPKNEPPQSSVKPCELKKSVISTKESSEISSSSEICVAHLPIEESERTPIKPNHSLKSMSTAPKNFYSKPPVPKGSLDLLLDDSGNSSGKSSKCDSSRSSTKSSTSLFNEIKGCNENPCEQETKLVKRKRRISSSALSPVKSSPNKISLTSLPREFKIFPGKKMSNESSTSNNIDSNSILCDQVTSNGSKFTCRVSTKYPVKTTKEDGTGGCNMLSPSPKIETDGGVFKVPQQKLWRRRKPVASSCDDDYFEAILKSLEFYDNVKLLSPLPPSPEARDDEIPTGDDPPEENSLSLPALITDEVASSSVNLAEFSTTLETPVASVKVPQTSSSPDDPREIVPQTSAVTVEYSLTDPASTKSSSLLIPSKATDPKMPQTMPRTIMDFELGTSSDSEDEMIQCFSKFPKLISPLRPLSRLDDPVISPAVSPQPSKIDLIEKISESTCTVSDNSCTGVSSPLLTELSIESVSVPVTNCATNPDQSAPSETLKNVLPQHSHVGAVAIPDENKLRTEPADIADPLTPSSSASPEIPTTSVKIPLTSGSNDDLVENVPRSEITLISNVGDEDSGQLQENSDFIVESKLAIGGSREKFENLNNSKNVGSPTAINDDTPRSLDIGSQNSLKNCRIPDAITENSVLQDSSLINKMSPSCSQNVPGDYSETKPDSCISIQEEASSDSPLFLPQIYSTRLRKSKNKGILFKNSKSYSISKKNISKPLQNSVENPDLKIVGLPFPQKGKRSKLVKKFKKLPHSSNVKTDMLESAEKPDLNVVFSPPLQKGKRSNMSRKLTKSKKLTISSALSDIRSILSDFDESDSLEVSKNTSEISNPEALVIGEDTNVSDNSNSVKPEKLYHLDSLKVVSSLNNSVYNFDLVPDPLIENFKYISFGAVLGHNERPLIQTYSIDATNIHLLYGTDLFAIDTPICQDQHQVDSEIFVTESPLGTVPKDECNKRHFKCYFNKKILKNVGNDYTSTNLVVQSNKSESFHSNVTSLNGESSFYKESNDTMTCKTIKQEEWLYASNSSTITDESSKKEVQAEKKASVHRIPQTVFRRPTSRRSPSLNTTLKKIKPITDPDIKRPPSDFAEATETIDKIKVNTKTTEVSCPSNLPRFQGFYQEQLISRDENITSDEIKSPEVSPLNKTSSSCELTPPPLGMSSSPLVTKCEPLQQPALRFPCPLGFYGNNSEYSAVSTASEVSKPKIAASGSCHLEDNAPNTSCSETKALIRKKRNHDASNFDVTKPDFKRLKADKPLNIHNGKVLECQEDIFMFSLKYFLSSVKSGDEKVPETTSVRNKSKVELIQNLIKRIMGASNDNIFSCCNNIVKASHQEITSVCPKDFFRAIHNMISKDDKPFSDEKPYVNKVVLACTAFTLTVVGREANQFLSEILSGAEEILCSYHQNTLDLFLGAKLTAYYAILCKAYELEERLKLSILDIMYSKYWKAYGMIYMILLIWPEVLVNQKRCALKDFVLTETIVKLLKSCKDDPKWMKRKPTKAKSLQFNCTNLRNHLERVYGYYIINTLYNRDEMVSKIIPRLSEEGAQWALLLLTRFEKAEYARDVVQKKMFPILEGWIEGKINSDYARSVLITSAMIVRAFPPIIAEGFIKTTLDLFEKILHSSTDAYFTEGVIESIVILRRHNLHLCAAILMKYTPPFGAVTERTTTLVRQICSAIQFTNCLKLYESRLAKPDS